MNAFSVAVRTRVGSIAPGIGGAAVFASILTFGVWILTEPTKSSESRALQTAALSGLGVALLAAGVLWTWGRYLEDLLVT